LKAIHYLSKLTSIKELRNRRGKTHGFSHCNLATYLISNSNEGFFLDGKHVLHLSAIRISRIEAFPEPPASPNPNPRGAKDRFVYGDPCPTKTEAGGPRLRLVSRAPNQVWQ
jgi:hypothetical protein